MLDGFVQHHNGLLIEKKSTQKSLNYDLTHRKEIGL